MEYDTVSPASESVADTVPTAALVAAFSAIENLYDDAPNTGRILQTLVVLDAFEDADPKDVEYGEPSPLALTRK